MRSLLARRFRFATSVLVVVAAPAFFAACGGKSGAKTPRVSPDGGVAVEVAGATSVFRPASSITPLPMPAPPFFGSKIGTVRETPNWKRGATLGFSGKVPADAAAFARASTSSPGKKIASFAGKLEAGAPPSTHPLSAKAGRCYRAYAAMKSGAVGTLAIVDSAGATATEGRPLSIAPFLAAPEQGAVCFSADDAAQVVLSLGLGDSDYGLEVWSD